MKKGIALVLLGFCWNCLGSAQQTAGTSGLLNTPSADFNPDGTFSLGMNYLPEAVTPSQFSYPTGNYFLNITYFSFLEVTYRATFLRVPTNGNKMTNQDRSVTLRVRPWKESRLLPALVVGANDILTSSFLSMVKDDGHNNQYFGNVYGVVTKNIGLSGHNLGLTLGYQYAREEGLRGVLAGIRYNPAFYRPLSFIVEYDGTHVNAGVSALLFKHLYLQVFTPEFKDVSFGIAYRYQLKVF